MGTDWKALVDRLTKAERDAAEWREGLADAEANVTALKGQLLENLGVGPGNGNGAAARPVAGRVPRVRRIRRDFKRRDRILALVKARGGFITPGDVQSSEKVSRQCANGHLSRLAVKGKLRRVLRGRYTAVTAVA